MSTFDLASGYWQAPVRLEDRNKTAFITDSGMYRFKVMPFGLNNALVTFQHMMTTILGHLVSQCANFYLDDIVVYSANFETHLKNLRTVFSCLQKAGLTLKP